MELFDSDAGLFVLINQARHPVLDVLSLAISTAGDFGWLWIGIAVALIAFGNHSVRRTGWTTLVALALAYVAADLILKPLIGRSRPGLVLDDVVTQGLDYSWNLPSFAFPSGHVAGVTAFAIVMDQVFPKFRWLWLSLPFLMAWSRIYNGAHWPLDTLGGLIIGGLTSWLALRLLPPIPMNR